jgi:hypothetical protein
MKKLFIAAVALTLALGCQKQPSNDNATSSTPVAAAPSLSPEELGELGAKIKAHPSDAQKILADAGLTEAAFEQQIRKVSSDPAASKRYAAAYKRARA